ncbi:elongation factor 2 kinase [Fistulifera solaris]|uniref:Elongation factor 2 kinase n=1 Tax=Fistulifera solaris TaxID=1519565 RepID=A0A1Z5KGB1_FISSO|nr:elongation factor 2 kinase [Fistulifera solaris]|eukprot:GAX25257.1 elongation factor 2 kinase [Fistulifera solaris]
MDTATIQQADRNARKKSVLQLLRSSAAQAIEEGDPWAKHEIHKIPAERVIRHLYNPQEESWTSDETIVKIERDSFTNGAMRFCYRMKKRAQPPLSATNRGFHKLGWAYANNYVAKAYHKGGVIDTSDEAKRAVQNDIMLQYEAQYWATRFNACEPPSKIVFIRAYAVEFPDRPGKPWFAVERFIAGTDRYGAGFVKHNTNAGFVDTDLRRITPQVFSAFSFHASQGNRLVADIQGVGDLYTDPQVLSSDYRFGDGDLGPRGMALFFKNFRHSTLSDALGIPVFPLSRNELKSQAKYEEDEETISDDDASLEEEVNTFQKLDANRMRRQSALLNPRDLLPEGLQDTQRQSNISRRQSISDRVRHSLLKPRSPGLARSSSDVDEITACLIRAKHDLEFSHRDFHRKISGELRERHFKRNDSDGYSKLRGSAIVRKVSAPMVPSDETTKNLGKIHYQLAVLHGMGRFPETVPDYHGDAVDDHDVASVVFHLSYAAALHNAPACLALARVQANLESSVSNLLSSIIPVDFEGAKELLRRAMNSPYTPSSPKAAAGCLLIQILRDESSLIGEQSCSDEMMEQILADTVNLINSATEEKDEATRHKTRSLRLSTQPTFNTGDRVEGNYSLEGTYYSGTVQSVADDGNSITVCYDDDGSLETLGKNHVRLLIPPTATQTTLGGPLSDEEAFGGEGEDDDKFAIETYDLLADLAQVKERLGKVDEASRLYALAADEAVNAGKMKVASEWSLKAAELH